MLKSKSHILKIFLLLVLLGGGGLWYFYGHVEYRNNDLTLYGNVEVRQVQLSYRVGGRIARLFFQEGDLVETGQLLGQLETDTLQCDLDTCLAQVAECRAQLAALQAGNRPQEIKQAQARVEEYRAGLEVLHKEFNRKKSLVEKNLIDEQSYDDVFARREEMAARLEGARANACLLEAGSREEDIAVGQARLVAANARAAAAQTNLNDSQLLAPSSGVILIRVQEPGAVVSSGQTIYTLSLVDPVWVRAYVNERQLGLVRPGLTAHIYTDSRIEPYQGQVGFISSEAEFTPKSIYTEELRADLVYRLRLVVQNPDERLRQGMPVTVRFPDLAKNTMGR